MEPGNTDNTDDDVVQPPVNNTVDNDAGKTAPPGKSSKKPDFSDMKFRCYGFRVMPPPSLKFFLRNKYKSLDVIAMNVTQCNGNFRPSLTLGFNTNHSDCNDDWLDAEKFEFEYGEKKMTFKVPAERVDSDKMIRVVPSMTKIMYINQLPVALAMHSEKIPEFFPNLRNLVAFVSVLGLDLEGAGSIKTK